MRVLALKTLAEGSGETRVRLSSGRLASLYHSLSLAYGAGVPLGKAIQSLSAGNADPATTILEGCRRRLLCGYPFWRALSESGCFPSHHVEMLRLGELSGVLSDSLGGLAVYQERSHALQSRLRSVLAYPFVMLLLSFGLILVLPGILFKPIFEFLAASKVEISWGSRTLMAGFELAATPMLWLSLLILICLGFSPLKRRLKALSWEKWVLKTPVAGPLWRQVLTIRFLRGLNSVVATGGSLLTGLELSASCSGSSQLKAEIRQASLAVREGANLGEALLLCDSIPGVYLGTLTVGLETGRLDTMLPGVCRLAEVEFESRLDCLVGCLEPLTMLLIGVVVGSVIAFTMSPMLELMRSLA